MNLNLNNKKVLVTGASKGLGFATALLLAQEGARIVINSRSESNLRSAKNQISDQVEGEVGIVVGDLLDKKAPSKIVNNAAEQLGGLDIIITNAGGPPSGKFESFSEDDWDKAINLSFMSHVRLIKAALPFLRNSQAASVLTITSISVKQPIPNLILSNSIRAATIGLTKTLALELAPDSVRFNSILPSWTETERVYELLSQRAIQNSTSIEEELRIQGTMFPLGRMATPQEFANVAVFLVSPAASYLNGLMLPVDGGFYAGVY